MKLEFITPPQAGAELSACLGIPMERAQEIGNTVKLAIDGIAHGILNQAEGLQMVVAETSTDTEAVWVAFIVGLNYGKFREQREHRRNSMPRFGSFTHEFPGNNQGMPSLENLLGVLHSGPRTSFGPNSEPMMEMGELLAGFLEDLQKNSPGDARIDQLGDHIIKELRSGNSAAVLGAIKAFNEIAAEFTGKEDIG